MGGFALSKIRSRKGSLLSRNRAPTLTPAIDKANKPNNDAVSKAPALPANANAIDSSSSTEVSATVTYDSSNDGSTLSSVHSDSLTSFAGNLSPPQVEFITDNNEIDKILRQPVPPTTPSIKCKETMKKKSSAPAERQLAVQLEKKVRSSPAAVMSSKKLSKRKARSRDAMTAMVGKQISSSSKSPARKKSPAKERIKAAIVCPSLSEITIPSILATSSKIKEEFEPTSKIRQEVNEFDFALIMGLLEGIKPHQGDIAGCDVFGGLFDCDAHGAEA